MYYPSRLPRCLAKKIAMSEFSAEFPPHWLLPQLVTRSNHPFLSAPPLLVVVTMVVEMVMGVVLVVRVVGFFFFPNFFRSGSLFKFLAESGASYVVFH